MRWILVLLLLSCSCADSAQPAAQKETFIAHLGQADETESDRSIGYLHPMLVHFPIVLFITAFVFDWLFLRRKIDPHSYRSAHWLVIAGALIAIPTMITGLYAATMSDLAGNPNIPVHKFWGFITLSYSMLHAIFRGYILKTESVSSRKLVALISFINVVLIGLTAEYGGTITHGRGFFEHSVQHSHSGETPSRK